jgi:hypothetical protein
MSCWYSVYGCGKVKCYLCRKNIKCNGVHHNNSPKIALIQKETTRPDVGTTFSDKAVIKALLETKTNCREEHQQADY